MPRMEEEVITRQEELNRPANIELDKIPQRFAKDFGIRQRLHELVRDHPDFEVISEPTFDPYCFRYVPNAMAERQEEPEVQRMVDQLNEEIIESVQRIGLSLITTRIHNRVAIQISFPSNGSLPSNVDATFEAIARWGRLINKKRSVSHRTTPDMEHSNV